MSLASLSMTSHPRLGPPPLLASFTREPSLTAASLIAREQDAFRASDPGKPLLIMGVA